VVEEGLNVFPTPGGEVVDDDDVVVLCRSLCKVRAKPAPPVTMERMNMTMPAAGLGLSELNSGIRV
jgi:hypothetical protein